MQARSPRFLSWVVQALCFSVSRSSGRMLKPVVNCIGLYVLVPSFKTLYLIDTLHTIGYLLLSFIRSNRNVIRGIISLLRYPLLPKVTQKQIQRFPMVLFFQPLLSELDNVWLRYPKRYPNLGYFNAFYPTLKEWLFSTQVAVSY